MSFGFSVSDAILLVDRAWDTVQNARKAVGEHDELTHEVTSLISVLERLEQDFANPASLINKPEHACSPQFQPIVNGCKNVLETLNLYLKKYNRLSRKERGRKKLWQCLRFGNQLIHLRDLRSKLSYHTSIIGLFLDVISTAAIGKGEQRVGDTGRQPRELFLAVNDIAALVVEKHHRDGSGLTIHSDDDAAVWKTFRRELIQDGFRSRVIDEYKDEIQAYVRELGNRGALDEIFRPARRPQTYDNPRQHQHMHQHQDEERHLRVHAHYAGPSYDGSLGLGSMLGFESPENAPPVAAHNELLLENDLSDTTSDSGLSDDDSDDIHDTTNTLHTPYQHTINRSRIPNLQSYVGPGDLEVMPSGNHSSAAIRRHRIKSLPKSPIRIERRRKRNKHMRNVFFGSVFAAHILISFV